MKYLLSTLAALSTLTIPSVALAQFSSDSAADTVLLADDIVSAKNSITLSGQADIRQGDVRLLADKVVIYTDGGTSNGLVSTDGFTRVVATGNFFYITPEQEVRGDKGVYTAATDSFAVTGDVVLLQEDSVVTGERLNYNLTTGEAKVVGDCNGRKCGKGRRVAILIRNSDSTQGVN